MCIKLKDLTLREFTVLVGLIARMYDDNMSVQKIAESCCVPTSWVNDILGIILVARDPDK